MRNQTEVQCAGLEVEPCLFCLPFSHGLYKLNLMMLQLVISVDRCLSIYLFSCHQYRWAPACENLWRRLVSVLSFIKYAGGKCSEC